MTISTDASYVSSIIAEAFILIGIIINITSAKAAIFIASILKNVLFRHIPIPKRIQAAGINIVNAAYPVSVTRYFSRKTTIRMIIKYEVRSASLFATGVVASPGIAAIAADAAAEAAVSFKTSAFFSSKDSIVFV